MNTFTQMGRFALTVVLWVFAAFSAAAQFAPYAHTQTAGPVTAANATLNGVAAPNGLPTSAWFEWGTNSNYGNVTALTNLGGESNFANVAATVGNLAIGAAYQFRLVCSNSLGVVVGLPQQFATRGTTVGWGDNGRGQLMMSLDWNHNVAIAAGYYHTLTLDYDGQVAVFGTFRNGSAFVPEGVSNIVAIGSGWDHCLAVTLGRRVVAWGGCVTNLGQTNVPAGLSNVIAVAGGELHSLALRDDGSVVAWGDNSYSQTNVPTVLSNVVAIAAGARHNLALRNDGIVTAWGDGASGKTTIPLGLSNVVAVAAGTEHSMALKRDGTVILWGGNSYGQRTLPSGLSNIVAIAAGHYLSMALKADGTVVTWGRAYGGTFTNLGKVVAIAGGYLHAVALRASPSVSPRAAIPFVNDITAHSARFDGFATPNGFDSVAWFEWGELGNGYGNATPLVNVGDGMHIVRVRTDVSGLAEGGRYQCRLVVSNAVGVSTSWERRFTTGSKLTAWGYDYAMAYGSESEGTTRIPPGLTNAVAMDGARGHSLVLKNDGTVLAWGLNDHGQANVPSGLTNVLDVSAGGWHSLALKQDGTVVAWGWNSRGETDVPNGLSNIVQVAAGGWHSAALKDDGTVVVWGLWPFWEYAQLLTNPPPGLTDVTAIATSGDHILARRSDGRVFSWGDGGIIRSLMIPTAASNVVAISAGVAHDLALRDDGTVVRWGGDSYPPTTPPTNLTNAVAVAAGWDHSLALRSDGSVTAWTINNSYYNTYGQTNVPPGLSNVVAIAAGEEFSLALGSDVPLVIAPAAFTGYVNADLVIPLPALDPNGDPITYRIVSLPAAGSLFQYAAGVRGPAITAPGATVNDSWGRVIFAPDFDGVGSPYTTFNFTVYDGVADSAPAAVTVNIVLPPVPQIVSTNSGWSTNAPGAFELNFTGTPNAVYSAYASTNLVDWERLGLATQVTNGVFQFLDLGATNWPHRFYRAGAP